MDLMSIYKVIVVTIPENICSIYIAFLLTGNRLQLPFRDNKNDRKDNFFKLLICVALFTLVQYLGRFLIKDMSVYFVTNMLASIFIIAFVYNEKNLALKDKKALAVLANKLKMPFVQVGIIFITLATIETIYIPPVLNSIGITSMSDAYNIPWVNLALPQIDRFFQILILTLVWNYERMSKNIINYNCKKPVFLISFIYVIIVEFGFSYLYVNSYKNLSVQLKVVFCALVISMCIFNVLFYKIELGVIDKIYQRHRKKGEIKGT